MQGSKCGFFRTNVGGKAADAIPSEVRLVFRKRISDSGPKSPFVGTSEFSQVPSSSWSSIFAGVVELKLVFRRGADVRVQQRM
jgi:hypothetical protein